MDASYKIQRGIHVHLIQFFMCPEFWVHISKHPLFSFLQGGSAALFFLKNPGFCGQMKVFPVLYLRGKERRASTASEYPLAIFGFREPSP